MYKWPIKKAAREHGIPRSTLQRYLNQCHIDGSVAKKSMGRVCVLSTELEEELSEILIDMERRLYGLSTEDVRKVVFQFCEANKIKHNFNSEKQIAGRKWLASFLARRSELSIRKPEGTSIQRALGYNISKIKIFEQVLKQQLFCDNNERRIAVENIFNVDETGLTVNHKPKKILAKKGKKSVSVITSAEKGKTITAVCCVSAAGAYCPPLMIFPRARFKDELMDRGPVGVVGVANKSGWINEAVFSQWFDHFLKWVQPQHRSTPCLLVMDGHSSHTNNLDVILKARANNVSLLVLPSHCTHKIQPLDVAVFKSLKSHYDRAVDTWLRNHPGRAVQESNVAELFADAWGKAATVANAVSGFAKSRIHPFSESNPDDDDYFGSDVTNMPEIEKMPSSGSKAR
jgi:DDE superfamily endonuclease/helix-turn-helix, Psq domain